MKIKEAIKGITDNIENTYFRMDFSFMFKSSNNGCFLIPTIELCKSTRFFEINIWIFCSVFTFVFSKEHYNEDEPE